MLLVNNIILMAVYLYIYLFIYCIIIYLTKSLPCIVSRILLLPLTFEAFAITLSNNNVNIYKCTHHCAFDYFLMMHS